jgi:hypothetical protein
MNGYQRPAAKLARRLGWNHIHGDGLRPRLWDLASDGRPWWDWGHRLMTVVGSDFGGNWDEPKPPTWWYRLGTPTWQFRTGFPRHPLSTFEVITDYTTFRERTAGLNEDQMYEWQAIYVNQDGELSLGHRYWGGDFYGLRKAEVALLRRYLRMWHRHDWYGLRSWLYSQGLHAAVHAKKPGSCQAIPPRGSGGYDHWHCTEKRRHLGLHRYNAMTWGEVAGEPTGVIHDPAGSLT